MVTHIGPSIFIIDIINLLRQATMDIFVIDFYRLAQCHQFPQLNGANRRNDKNTNKVKSNNWTNQSFYIGFFLLSVCVFASFAAYAATVAHIFPLLQN